MSRGMMSFAGIIGMAMWLLAIYVAYKFSPDIELAVVTVQRFVHVASEVLR